MEKMKLSCMILVIALFVSGCNVKQEATSINIDDMVNDIHQNVVFQDELSDIDDSVAKKLYNMDGIVDLRVMRGSGATSEEIGAFEFEDKKAAKKAIKVAQTYIDNQKKSFENYNPEEVKRLENAIIKQFEQYLILCISEGDAAGKRIADYLK